MKPDKELLPGNWEGPLSRSVQVAVLTVGVGLVTTGAVAVFTTRNDAGTAALLAVGTALVVLAIVGDRIQTIRFRELEIKLAEQHVELAFRAARELESAGKTEEAAQFRNEALDGLQELRSIGRTYMQTRETMPPGWKRTMKMERDFAEIRQQARKKPPTSDDIGKLLEGDPGQRITALAAMKELPNLRDFNRVHGVIKNWRSPFEHYHAMDIARDMVPRLDPEERAELSRTIESERRRFGGDRDRHNLADNIESAIRAQGRRTDA